MYFPWIVTFIFNFLDFQCSLSCQGTRTAVARKPGVSVHCYLSGGNSHGWQGADLRTIEGLKSHQILCDVNAFQCPKSPRRPQKILCGGSTPWDIELCRERMLLGANLDEHLISYYRNYILLILDCTTWSSGHGAPRYVRWTPWSYKKWSTRRPTVVRLAPEILVRWSSHSG